VCGGVGEQCGAMRVTTSLSPPHCHVTRVHTHHMSHTSHPYHTRHTRHTRTSM
jgi:hypothetical protein